MEDSDKVLRPGRDLLLVALREDESQYRMPFTLLDDLLLDPCNSSAIKTSVSE